MPLTLNCNPLNYHYCVVVIIIHFDFQSYLLQYYEKVQGLNLFTSTNLPYPHF